MTNLLTNLPQIGVVHCNKCRAALAVSLGRSVLIGGVILYGKMRLECAYCKWGTWFYPSPKTSATAEPQASANSPVNRND